MNDKSNVKEIWAKNKSKIDEAINTKVPIGMDRKMCKCKKRTSIIENVYNCKRDHKCDASRK